MSKNKLKAALDALQPIIFVNTVEPVRFRDLFLFPAVSEAMKCPIKDHPIRRVTRLSSSTCRRWTNGDWNKAEKIFGDNANWYTQLNEIRESNIPGSRPDEKIWLPEILWLANIDQKVNPGDKQDEALIDCLLEAAMEFQSRYYKHVLITGTALRVPDVLRPFTEIIDCPLPNEAEVSALTARILERYSKTKLPIDQKSVGQFVRNAKGLTESEIQQSLCNAVALYQKFDERAPRIAQERKQARALASGVLEIRTVTKTLDSMGGGEALKSYIDGIKPILLSPEKAKAYGVRVPGGCLLAGPPGSGKSLACEAIAGTLGVGFARFSLGNIFGQFVGQSETNLRESFKMIEAIAPVVVMFDEVEKMLASDGAGHATFQICKGIILTWLQEKPEGVFCAMSCNKLDSFNDPANNALIRDGRVDKIFFVDLPGPKAREEIFKIHLAAAGHPMPGLWANSKCKNGKTVIDSTRGFSGAEIEGVVGTALREGFAAGVPHPTIAMICEAAAKKKPQSVTMKESIDALRAWVKDGRADLAGESVEDSDIATETTGDVLGRFGAIPSTTNN